MVSNLVHVPMAGHGGVAYVHNVGTEVRSEC